MYEKEINLIDVSFIFLKKSSFQGMCSTGSQNAQNQFWWGMTGGPMSLSMWPRIFRLLGCWPTNQKFQNDYCVLGVRDITGILVNPDSGVPRYVSRYAFDHTGTFGQVRQFPILSSKFF